jgi:hypothetical protein
MLSGVEMASCGMIYLPSFMKTGTGIKTIIKFGLRNFNDCNVGNTNGRDL